MQPCRAVCRAHGSQDDLFGQRAPSRRAVWMQPDADPKNISKIDYPFLLLSRKVCVSLPRRHTMRRPACQKPPAKPPASTASVSSSARTRLERSALRKHPSRKARGRRPRFAPCCRCRSTAPSIGVMIQSTRPHITARRFDICCNASQVSTLIRRVVHLTWPMFGPA